MTKILYCFLFLSSNILLGQNYYKDLFIDIQGSCLQNLSQIKSDTLTNEVYRLNLLKPYHNQYKLSINDDGLLSKNIVVTTSVATPTLFLTYNNEKGNNPILNVEFNEIKNILNCDEIQYRFESDLNSIFNYFQNVYMLYSDKNKYSAKKIDFKFNRGL